MANILLVDDEKNMRITLSKFLDKAGHNVWTAQDVKEAKALFLQQTYDVVVTDIILPDASGVELLKFIRNRAAEVQVVMMTGRPDVETAAEIVRLGAADYLVKPVNKNAILRSVSNALTIKIIDDQRRELIRQLRHQYSQKEALTNKLKDLLHLLRHDIENAIVGSVALLDTEKDSLEVFRSAEGSLRQILLHCQAVIHEVRAKQNESAYGVVLDTVNLRELVDEACTTLKGMAATKDIELRNTVDSETCVRVDAGSFVMHVMNNILSNAIKFSYPGGRIEVSDRCDDDGFIGLITRDHGCGIPPQKLACLLDDSTEVPHSTPGTAGELGTGYGLRHARKCMEELGGSLQIASTCGDDTAEAHAAPGTTVTVRLRAGRLSGTTPDMQDPADHTDTPPPPPPCEPAPRDVDRAGAAEASRADGPPDDVRSRGTGIIVVEDAWPVSDTLCTGLAGMLIDADETTHCHITYARTPPLPFHVAASIDDPRITVQTIPDRASDQSADEQLREAIAMVADDATHLLIIQERNMLKAFYELAADADFRRRVAASYRVLAVDYELGQAFYGTDLSRRLKGLLNRVLVSANAVEYLPEDLADTCEGRIDKSSVKMTTLVQRIADFDGSAEGFPPAPPA